jgi:hypothetical protein
MLTPHFQLPAGLKHSLVLVPSWRAYGSDFRFKFLILWSVQRWILQFWRSENVAVSCQGGLLQSNMSGFMWSNGGMSIARGEQKTLEDKRVGWNYSRFDFKYYPPLPLSGRIALFVLKMRLFPSLTIVFT